MRSCVLFLMLALGLPLLSQAQPAASERTWVSFDGLARAPLSFETRIPATASLIDGPPGHRAVRVTVPDMSRDERACAFNLTLPVLGGKFNAAKLWLKGDAKTSRLEIVFSTPAGTYGADVPIGPDWRQVTLSPQNTRPYFGTKQGSLDVAKATSVRFCFGAWQGATGGPHTVSLGPLIAVASPDFAAAGKVTTIHKPNVPLPPQPFTVELLDLRRGQWHFLDALGQHLELAGPVPGFAFVGAAKGEVRLAYLLCDPEFPGDLSHAALDVCEPLSSGADGQIFRIDEPYFAATVEVAAPTVGVARCSLRAINLGPATTGDRYVAAMYVMVGGKPFQLWLAPDDDVARLNPRLLTDRVGGIFSEGEPVKVTLASWPAIKPGAAIDVEAKNYATGEVAWRGSVKSPAHPAGLQQTSITLPLRRFGIYEVTASAPGLPAATTRICLLPRPARVDPARSSIGINIFQQQIWWYAYQVPMMAEAGVHWIRPWLAWENTWNVQEPQRGKWDTRALDAALRRMDKFGERYQDILWGAPSWATGSGSNVPPVDKMNLWAAYVGKLVRQYRGRIKYYEVWNEPDGMWPEATRHQGVHYVAMLKASYEAAKRADPGCTIIGLSLAGYEQWLENVGKLGAKDYLDDVSIHVYSSPHDFLGIVHRRQDLLRRYGMGDKPLWINELGTTAYDFSPAYSKQYDCSELKQASWLPALYAEAMSVDPKMKAYWFCTYDPRDPAHKDQWTGDAGIGIVYLGFLPKLAYASLAGVAREIDGRECLGYQDVSDEVHQVSFSGPVAVVWDDRWTKAPPLRATDLGCLPSEHVVVRDMFGNQVADARADAVKLHFTHGPLYVEGSRELAARAQAERAGEISRREVMLAAGTTAEVALPGSHGGHISVEVQPGLPVTATVRPAKQGGGWVVVLSAPKNLTRASGIVRISTHFAEGAFGLAEPREVVRTVHVTAGEPNYIPDGGFFLGNLYEWTPERTSAYAWDPTVGHTAPGSLRLDAPFDRRLVHYGVNPKPGRPIRLRFWVKTNGFEGATATVSLAFFAPGKWLSTFCFATSGKLGEIEKGWTTIDGCGKIPTGTSSWTPIDVTLPADKIPAGASTAAFFVDLKGGGQGHIWFDDFDLWQPAK